MKKLPLIFILIQLVFASVFSQNTEPENVINSIRENYVPDKRVCIYDVFTEKRENSLVLKGKISDSFVYQKLLQAFEKEGITFVDSVKVLPENTIGEKHWGIVPLSAIFIRSAPEYSAEITNQATLGTPVKILDKKGGWLLIQTPGKYIGWTNTSIRRISKNELSNFNKGKRVFVTDINSVVYEKPSDKSQRIMEVLIGNIMTLEDAEITGEFTQISLPDGRKGFVASKSILSISDWQNSIHLNGDNIIETAKLFLGLPYLWGGTSSRGFDCSGFTKYVYFNYGLIFPRDASQQYFCGEKVDISTDYDKLNKGDLLFFGSKTASNPDKFKVVHVAIYMGNKRFIHASGEIRMNSLDPDSPDYDEYNKNRLIGAKRIIGTSMQNISNVFENEWYK